MMKKLDVQILLFHEIAVLVCLLLTEIKYSISELHMVTENLWTFYIA